MAPFLIGAFWFSYQKSELKQDLQQRIEAKGRGEELQTFTFTLAELMALEWEDGREFRLKGEMYDIVGFKLVGKQYELRCFHDQEERKLEQERADWVARLMGNNPHQKSQRAFVINWVKTLIPMQWHAWQMESEISQGQFVEIEIRYQDRLKCRPLSPPPQFS